MTLDPKEIEDVLPPVPVPDDDPEWIKKGDGNYEFELFMSTDGKHTVHVKATTPEGKRKALNVATETYDYLVTRYGTKQAQAVKEYGNGRQEEKVNQDTCKHINVKFAQAKTEKNAGRWFKSCSNCNKFLGWQG